MSLPLPPLGQGGYYETDDEEEDTTVNLTQPLFGAARPALVGEFVSLSLSENEQNKYFGEPARAKFFSRLFFDAHIHLIIWLLIS